MTGSVAWTRVPTAGGAGLGLSIVQAIAHAHGGRALAGNRDGGGAWSGSNSPARRTPRKSAHGRGHCTTQVISLAGLVPANEVGGTIRSAQHRVITLA